MPARHTVDQLRRYPQTHASSLDASLENVARAYSVGEAQRGLMQSPGHRRNCLATEVTHVGVGVSLGREIGGRRELYVTQLFAEEAPAAIR